MTLDMSPKYEMLNRAVEMLTQLSKVDPEALGYLFDVYAPCNDECNRLMGPYIIECQDEDEEETFSAIGPLGLINAIIDDPRYAVAAVYTNGDEDVPVLRGFGIFDRDEEILLDGGFDGESGFIKGGETDE